MIQLNEEQRIILNTVRQISQEKNKPRAAEIDEAGEFPVERMMRDAKLTQIYTGTNQITRVAAAREIFKGVSD